MRIVHHLENSRSLRVLWMLEELGLDYELRRYPRDPKTLLAPPELRNVHPLGKSPVLQDGELVLAESGAILDYLADRYDTQRQLSPSPMPADGAERIAYRYWLHYAEGSAMPPLLLTLVMGRIRNAPMPFFARPIARSIADKAERGFIGPQRRLHLDWMERRLAESPWFAGERFSAADIQMSFPIQAAAVVSTTSRHCVASSSVSVSDPPTSVPRPTAATCRRSAAIEEGGRRPHLQHHGYRQPPFRQPPAADPAGRSRIRPAPARSAGCGLVAGDADPGDGAHVAGLVAGCCRDAWFRYR